ncbi:hypothetical protein [Absidia glauca]|uniref:ORC6 second cyclin-like domain-containing protein n=1 Tax=Absidia glauca TaxID=4829 RepID=A0A168RG29_ABSGL|nr:hypothetical protein [Absidia glauca]
MLNPLEHCLDRLHLNDNSQLLDRARFYHGQCSSKVPVVTFKGPNSQHVASIQLAYESLGLFGWNSKLAAELAGCTLKAYDMTMSAVRKHLNLQSTITFDTLGITFGSTALATHSQDLWTHFVQQHISKLGPAQQLSAKDQLSTALWKAAAFYVCAKAVGVQIDKSKLQSVCTCGASEFNKSVKLIKEECKAKLIELKTQSTDDSRPTRKRKTRRNDDEEDTVDAANSDDTKDANTTTPAKSKKTRSTKSGTAAASSSSSSTATSSSSIPKSSTKQKASVLLKKTSNKKGAVSGIVSMINLQDYRSSQRYMDYLSWEQNIKQQLSH